MFTTCLFCNKPLGSNEVIETFPVGRRLAFDAARGRLWVVCRKCERWNLTPLEERWEAVEDCERIFRATRVRVSTENIGLARHPEGLTLVRIGEPLRPEFAAWRYGDQFGRRRRKVAVYGGVVVAAATGLAVGGLVAGAAISTVLLPFQVMQFYLEEQERRALEGELWLLEQAWRDAEELAAISDDLLLPEGAEEFVRERGRVGDGGGSEGAT